MKRLVSSPARLSLSAFFQAIYFLSPFLLLISMSSFSDSMERQDSNQSSKRGAESPQSFPCGMADYIWPTGGHQAVVGWLLALIATPQLEPSLQYLPGRLHPATQRGDTYSGQQPAHQTAAGATVPTHTPAAASKPSGLLDLAHSGQKPAQPTAAGAAAPAHTPPAASKPPGLLDAAPPQLEHNQNIEPVPEHPDHVSDQLLSPVLTLKRASSELKQAAETYTQPPLVHFRESGGAMLSGGTVELGSGRGRMGKSAEPGKSRGRRTRRGSQGKRHGGDRPRGQRPDQGSGTGSRPSTLTMTPEETPTAAWAAAPAGRRGDVGGGTLVIAGATHHGGGAHVGGGARNDANDGGDANGATRGHANGGVGGEAGGGTRGGVGGGAGEGVGGGAGDGVGGGAGGRAGGGVALTHPPISRS
mmetsp:Transcript_19671/g.34020  ORF Transcript_19671/g.34020 Transcript_19671/m.34020 type:complete len:416 (+) Transcript_19671:234-1481(+)